MSTPPAISRDALVSRSLDALDFALLRDALAERARTPVGRIAAATRAREDSVAGVIAAFDAVDELRALEADGSGVPLGGVDDVAPLARRAAKGEVLENVELRAVASTRVALDHLAGTLRDASDDAPTLAGHAAAIQLDPAITDELYAAFDRAGELSSHSYPELGELRRAIRDLHATIRDTLERLVSGDTLGDVLQDRFVTQRGDRYVLPVKAHAKRWDLGIVHGTSGSGATVFVEPKEVVEANNRLRLAEGELAAAERRIRAHLSRLVGAEVAELSVSLDAAAVIDLAAARSALAERLDATRPHVADAGAVALRAARHPVLVLRGVDVVPGDLELSAATPALVVSGPNAGGKTVALKTLGTCALLVQHGCYVPAAEGSRVDLFHDVLALIGDHQGVTEDQSSFSSHLVALAAMLRGVGPGALLLIDELGSGTDPGQGGALARAVIERVVDAGGRLVVTTHYAAPKALALTDDRVAGAAVEYLDGQPTYRLRAGLAGESHALDTAARLGLDPDVVARARALVDAPTRALGDAMEVLEDERGQLEKARRELADAKAALAARQAKLAEAEAALEARRQALHGKQADAFADRLKRAEAAIAAVVADLQRAPSHGGAQAARATVDALRELVPAPAPTPEPAAVAVGDRVRLRMTGAVGVVEAQSGRELHVRTGAVVARVKPSDVEPVPDEPSALQAAMPKRRRPRRRAGKAPPVDLGAAVRMPGNTLDLRGIRVDEGLEMVDLFLDQASIAGHEVVFVLHGHGTGAMKQAVRQHLPQSPYVRRCAPANEDQGGDAFTVAALHRG